MTVAVVGGLGWWFGSYRALTQIYGEKEKPHKLQLDYNQICTILNL